MAKKIRRKTEFTTLKCLFLFKLMLFGLNGATFQRIDGYGHRVLQYFAVICWATWRALVTVGKIMSDTCE